jgi:hypothetical protein
VLGLAGRCPGRLRVSSAPYKGSPGRKVGMQIAGAAMQAAKPLLQADSDAVYRQGSTPVAPVQESPANRLVPWFLVDGRAFVAKTGGPKARFVPVCARCHACASYRLVSLECRSVVM